MLYRYKVCFRVENFQYKSNLHLNELSTKHKVYVTHIHIRHIYSILFLCAYITYINYELFKNLTSRLYLKEKSVNNECLYHLNYHAERKYIF